MDDEQHGQHPNGDAHDGEDASLPEGAADDPGSDQDHKDDGTLRGECRIMCVVGTGIVPDVDPRHVFWVMFHLTR